MDSRSSASVRNAQPNGGSQSQQPSQRTSQLLRQTQKLVPARPYRPPTTAGRRPCEMRVTTCVHCKVDLVVHMTPKSWDEATAKGFKLIKALPGPGMSKLCPKCYEGGSKNKGAQNNSAKEGSMVANKAEGNAGNPAPKSVPPAVKGSGVKRVVKRRRGDSSVGSTKGQRADEGAMGNAQAGRAPTKVKRPRGLETAKQNQAKVDSTNDELQAAQGLLAFAEKDKRCPDPVAPSAKAAPKVDGSTKGGPLHSVSALPAPVRVVSVGKRGQEHGGKTGAGKGADLMDVDKQDVVQKQKAPHVKQTNRKGKVEVGQQLIGNGVKFCRGCRLIKPEVQFVEPKRKGWYVCNECELLKRQKAITVGKRSPPKPRICKQGKGIRFDYHCSMPDVNRDNQRWKKLSDILRQLCDGDSKSPSMSCMPRVPVPATGDSGVLNNTVEVVNSGIVQTEHGGRGQYVMNLRRSFSGDASDGSQFSDDFIKCQECKKVQPSEGFRPGRAKICHECCLRSQCSKAKSQLKDQNKSLPRYGVHTHVTPLVIRDESSVLDCIQQHLDAKPGLNPETMAAEAGQSDMKDYPKVFGVASWGTGSEVPVNLPGSSKAAMLNPDYSKSVSSRPLESCSEVPGHRARSRKGSNPRRNGVSSTSRDPRVNIRRAPTVSVTPEGVQIVSPCPLFLPKHAQEKAKLFREEDMRDSIAAVGISGLIKFLLA
ncbi:hypothetical protein BSKO_04801 [Bryopsis sp. KO-2023]|nr:hypothetical protein BSKO_04801 [Bryopsis sp. KO-2023]